MAFFGRRWFARRWFSARWFGGPESVAPAQQQTSGAPWWWWAQQLRGDAALVPENYRDGIIVGHSDEVAGAARRFRRSRKGRIVGHTGAVHAGATIAVRGVIVPANRRDGVIVGTSGLVTAAADVPIESGCFHIVAHYGAAAAHALVGFAAPDEPFVIIGCSGQIIGAATAPGDVRTPSHIIAHRGAVMTAAHVAARPMSHRITARSGLVIARRRFDPVLIDNDLLMLATAA